MIKKILVANRGEIAVRVMRSCKEMEIRTIAVFSEADRAARHVMYADEAYCIGPAEARESYLNIDRIIQVALEHGADAIHPGYGFLSENPDFARRCRRAGIVFIGPEPETMEVMGDKISARRRMREAGVPVVPGTTENLNSSEEAIDVCNRIGYPVMLKASAGGGGKGMRLARKPEEVEEAFLAAKSEALASFGDDTVYIEKFVVHPHHIEFQILGDRHGNVIHLCERECSVQRRNQKIVEETPSPFISEALRRDMGEKAVAAAKAVNYVGAGTIEFVKVQHGLRYVDELVGVVELLLRELVAEHGGEVLLDAGLHGRGVEQRLGLVLHEPLDVEPLAGQLVLFQIQFVRDLFAHCAFLLSFIFRRMSTGRITGAPPRRERLKEKRPRTRVTAHSRTEDSAVPP